MLLGKVQRGRVQALLIGDVFSEEGGSVWISEEQIVPFFSMR